MVMSETYLPVYLICPNDSLKPSSHMSADFQKKWNESKVNTLYWIRIPFFENYYESQNVFVLDVLRYSSKYISSMNSKRQGSGFQYI